MFLSVSQNIDIEMKNIKNIKDFGGDITTTIHMAIKEVNQYPNGLPIRAGKLGYSDITIFHESKRAPWGHGLYSVDINTGGVKLIDTNYDSSG